MPSPAEPASGSGSCSSPWSVTWQSHSCFPQVSASHLAPQEALCSSPPRVPHGPHRELRPCPWAPRCAWLLLPQPHLPPFTTTHARHGSHHPHAAPGPNAWPPTCHLKTRLLTPLGIPSLSRSSQGDCCPWMPTGLALLRSQLVAVCSRPLHEAQDIPPWSLEPRPTTSTVAAGKPECAN